VEKYPVTGCIVISVLYVWKCDETPITKFDLFPENCISFQIALQAIKSGLLNYHKVGEVVDSSTHHG